ncbi:hypothetical protein [Salibacterium aidingense]|uniref:hypothetical protein n=1 Tax=Salibacterium aidingense TaxID=384933 RepID=UPI003BEDAC2D
MISEIEYTPEFYDGISIEEVVKAIKDVSDRRIEYEEYKRVRNTEDLKLHFIQSPGSDYILEVLFEIIESVMRGYLAKVSSNYKEFNKDNAISYGVCEDYKIIDALLSVNSQIYFFQLCYDLFDDLQFEV